MTRKTALTKPVPTPVDDMKPVSAAEDFWADERRSRCLDLIMNGLNKSQIAKQVGVHRNTINNWCADARFAAEANRRMNEHKAAKRIRRLRSMNVLGDKVERVAIAMITKVEDDLAIDDVTGKPTKPLTDDGLRSLRVFREINYEYRETREQERKDYGDDIKKVAINSHQTITGDVNVNHHGVNDTPFADYVKKAIDERIIDVDSIEVKEGDDGQLLLKAAELLMVDSELLETINDEDKAAEEASKSE